MSNITSNWEGIPVQVVEVKPDDVIIAQVSMHMDVSDCQQILQELQKTFPDNKVLIANKHILEKLTIFRPEDTVADIMAQVDIDKELKKILRRDHYDFLY